MRKATSALAYLIMIFLVMGTVLFVRIPLQGQLWRATMNAGHMLLFGTLSLGFLWVSQEFVGLPVSSEYLHYLVALIGGIGIGLAAEFVQYFGPRDANFYDVGMDALGCFVFLGFYGSFDRRLTGTWLRKRRIREFMMRLICIILLLLGFLPSIVWGMATVNRARIFPRICSFESRWENKFVVLYHAEMAMISPPAHWTGAHGSRAAAVTLYPAPYPGLTIEEPYPDWRRYDTLCLAVYLPEDTTVRLGVRIDDWHHDHTAGDRFTRAYTLHAGENRLCIPLTEVRFGPVNRKLDMAQIAAVWLFTANAARQLDIYIDNIRLE